MTLRSPRELLERLCGAGAERGDGPSVVLVAAHPDDEVIGAGARLRCWPRLLLVHATDGAPADMRDARAYGFATRAAYARARRSELLAALAIAGVASTDTRALDLVDQEASLHLEPLSRSVAAILLETRPEIVVAHPYEGGHPDHDAAAFAVHAACDLVRAEGIAPPTIVEMTSYHRRAPGDSADRGAMTTGEFLGAAADAPITLYLSETERQLKRRLLDCYATQRDVLRPFTLDAERFRLAPRYDFAKPPHEGPFLYEERGFQLSGARWRDLADRARRALRCGGER